MTSKSVEKRLAAQTSLTGEQIDRLSGLELDEAVAMAIGVIGETYWMASNDGGKSHHRDLWRNENAIRNWLTAVQGDGRLSGYEVIATVRYHPYHTDQGAALGLLMGVKMPASSEFSATLPIAIAIFSDAVSVIRHGETLATGPIADCASVLCRASLKLVNGE